MFLHVCASSIPSFKASSYSEVKCCCFSHLPNLDFAPRSLPILVAPCRHLFKYVKLFHLLSDLFHVYSAVWGWREGSAHMSKQGGRPFPVSLAPVMAAILSYFLLVLLRSKQIRGPKEEVHSGVASTWIGNSSFCCF